MVEHKGPLMRQLSKINSKHVKFMTIQFIHKEVFLNLIILGLLHTVHRQPSAFEVLEKL